MNMLFWHRRERCARTRLLPLLLAAGAALAACDGANLFPTDPIGGGGATPPIGENPGGSAPGASPDRKAPTLSFVRPVSGSTVAVGDSVFVEVRLGDDVALGSLELRGVALRGSRDLGTEYEVERFAAKKVEFPHARPVRDTTITRFLLATSDTLSEKLTYLVASARDTAGNVIHDTIQVAIGGPRVEIVDPAEGLEVRAGVPQEIRIVASDRVDRLRSVRLRVSGAMAKDTSFMLPALVEQVDTRIQIQVPSNVSGVVYLDASVVSAKNIEGTARRVALNVLPPVTDQVPPTVTFSSQVRQRVELDDTLVVTVAATDNERVGLVGASVVVLRWNGSTPEYFAAVRDTAVASSRTFRFRIGDLGFEAFSADELPVKISLEVTAFARDAAGNCASSTVPGVGLSEPCRIGLEGATLSDRPGSRSDAMVVRGQTVRLGNLDRFIDLVADSFNIYLSNFSQSRVEVVNTRTLRPASPVRVGSQPWGLALGWNHQHRRNELLVANSGGTNISRVPIGADGMPHSVEDVGARIATPNIRLYDVTMDVRTMEPSAVVEHSYSDRPQFMAQLASGDIVYSTKPTGSAAEGTLRRYIPNEDRVEFFIDYAHDLSVPNKIIVVNARSAALILSEPKTLQVCPLAPAGGSGTPDCIVGPVDSVDAALRRGGYPTRLRTSYNIEKVGLTDTTYVAVSKNREDAVFGEGRRDPSRVIWIKERGGRAAAQSGLVRDLLNNASERVTSLGMNVDGTLAVARGVNQAYFFTSELRLQGVSPVGSGHGGVDLHPTHASWPNPGAASGVSFVAGTAPDGTPVLDVVDTFHFDSRASIVLRDPVTGPVRTVRYTQNGQPVLRVFAITAGGLVALDIRPGDIGNPSGPLLRRVRR